MESVYRDWECLSWTLLEVEVYMMLRPFLCPSLWRI